MRIRGKENLSLIMEYRAYNYGRKSGIPEVKKQKS
jgi:hypothetical protein